jgi:hypothetical protein
MFGEHCMAPPAPPVAQQSAAVRQAWPALEQKLPLLHETVANAGPSGRVPKSIPQQCPSGVVHDPPLGTQQVLLTVLCSLAQVLEPSPQHSSTFVHRAPRAVHVTSQTPATHSPPVPHGVPSCAGGLEHAPVAGSQTPATWHSSDAVQATAVPGTHSPFWQWSFVVQALPSASQFVPFVAGE